MKCFTADLLKNEEHYFDYLLHHKMLKKRQCMKIYILLSCCTARTLLHKNGARGVQG